MSRTNSVAPLVDNISADENETCPKSDVKNELVCISNSTNQLMANDLHLAANGVHRNDSGFSFEIPSKSQTVSWDEEEDDGIYDEPFSIQYHDNLQLTFYHGMAPILNVMRFFGLWHSNVIDPHGSKMKSRGVFRKIVSGRTYGIVVLTLLWFNFLRFVPAFFVGSVLDPERLYFKIIYLTFMLQCALNHTVIYYAISRKKRMCQFFHHWETAIQFHPHCAVDLKWLRRWSWTFVAIGTTYISCHILNQSFGVFGPLEHVRNSTDIFVAPFPRHTVLHLIVLLCNIFCFASWIFTIFIYVLVCMILYRQFKQFNERFLRAIVKGRANKKFPENFESLRHEHENLCYALRLSNDHLFTYLNLVAYGTMVPLACILLYNLLFSQNISANYSAYFMYGVWLISIFVNICVVSWIAALVSTKAHDSRDHLFKIDLENVSTDQLIQMHTFLARLSGGPIGYTIYDLVVLSKPFILTIGGLGITYYALLVEVQTSEAPTLGT
ncbi:hypothetical protein HOLleu_21916 [Holothuria leucospilota]|uniref:Gustatory receptor n=1 Tax=Holothuria leucospilota TaxID=206669 RepID=A0A9Q1BYF1_HOLLE|nr:hypothetical protein HOLleu_21916 [Holothuria leucospilota]